ncbi:MAG: hypothetical protein HY298_22900 [Verrucomicrobia bacterium]|nr:hypothetical protein [Verrucomicrobiota bacterium]
MQLAARHPASARSPARLFVILAASLFVAEVIAMLLVAALPTMPPLLTNVLDATILVVLAFPALRAFAFVPLLRHLRAREAAEAQLQEVNRTLEQRVQERTHELQTANESLRAEIAERQRMQQERERLIADLQMALADVKQLSGLLPICAGCKKIRDDRGYWSHVESYIAERSEAKFTHGFCPACTKKFFPGLTPEDIDGP